MEDELSVIYDMDVTIIFRKLMNCNLAAIQDPMGISGNVQACSSEVQKNDALSKLNRANVRAQTAREAEKNGDTYSAFKSWDLLFNGKFPSYYH